MFRATLSPVARTHGVRAAGALWRPSYGSNDRRPAGRTPRNRGSYRATSEHFQLRSAECTNAKQQAIAEGAHFSNFKRMYLADLPQLDLPSLVDVHSLLANAQTAEVQVQELVAGLVDGGASDVTAAPGYSAPANSSAARPVITNSTASSADSASSRTASIPAATTQAASNGTGVSSSPTVSQITASQSTAAQTSATQSTAGNSSTPVIVTRE